MLLCGEDGGAVRSSMRHPEGWVSVPALRLPAEGGGSSVPMQHTCAHVYARAGQPQPHSQTIHCYSLAYTYVSNGGLGDAVAGMGLPGRTRVGRSRRAEEAR